MKNHQLPVAIKNMTRDKNCFCHLIAILIVIVIAHAMLERNVFQTTGAMLGSNII